MKFSQLSFNRWFKKQRGNRRFEYTNNCHCLFATWIAETRKTDFVYVRVTEAIIDGRHYPLPPWMSSLDNTMAGLSDDTFSVKELRDKLIQQLLA